MAIPTRFPGGLTTAAPDATLANLGQIDPTKFATFFDDLFIPAAALGTFTAIAGNGGLVTVATTKVIGTPAASFTPRASKRAFFKAKLSTSVVATGGVIAGFADVLGTATKGLTVSLMNGVLTLTNVYGSVSDTANVSYGVNEQVTIGLEYRPNVGVFAYFNDKAVARIPVPTFDATNLVAGVYSNGGTLTVDYFLASLER